MRAYGQFVFPREGLIIPNTVNDNLASGFLDAAFRGADLSDGTNFYVGLCGDAAAGETAALTDITDEVAVANGYARIAVPKNGTGFPTLEKLDSGFWRIVTQMLTFTAAGGDFDKAYTRLFICNVASGTVGNLYALSGARTVGKLVLNGQSSQVFYELFMR